MKGERIDSSLVEDRGFAGDRSYALQDTETGRMVSAKNPKKFGKLLDFGVTFVEPPAPGKVPAVMFSFPDGGLARSDDPDIEAILTEEIGSPVRLLSSVPEGPTYEEYWPDIEGRKHRDVLTEVRMPPTGFFDSSPVHIVTTATLGRLRELHPQGLFEPTRFRPNVVLETPDGGNGFLENEWIEKALRVGEVRLRVTKLCARCVMTTLPQGGLPQDVGILRTAVAGNGAHVGAYASVEKTGTMTVGDPVWLE
jgi:uncharacterized protein YcbX